MKLFYRLFFVAAVTLLPLCQSSAITRQQLANYASSLKGLKGASLKSALHTLMQPKKVLEYGSGSGNTWSGFYKTDRNPETNECYNRYSSKKFYFDTPYNNKAVSGMNIEHSFPKSWWGGTENKAYKDLYNLYPSDSKANSSKSNYPMDDVDGEGEYDIVGTGIHVGSKCWEPGRTFKGDFSRSYMYMAVTYSNLTFTSTGLKTMANEAYPGLKPWASKLYRQWSKGDKVDKMECDRNNAVAGIQGNRNLFVDYPFLAEYVWGDSVNVAFDPYSSITTASDDSRYGTYTPSPDDPNTNPDTPDTPDTPDDGFYWVKLTEGQPVAGKYYLIVAERNDSLLAMQPVTSSKGYGYGYVTCVGMASNGDTITTSDDANAFLLEAANKGYYIKDSKGKYYFNDGKHNTFSIQTGVTNGVWTVASSTNGTYKLTYGTHFVQYSTGYKSFGVYSSVQSGGIYPTLYVAASKEATGIQTISNGNTPKATAADGAIYTLQGVRVNAQSSLKPGIYVRNGHKFVVR